MRDTRPISWLKGALRDFKTFPLEVQTEILRALTIASEGGESDTAKPFKGVGSGVFEIAVRHRAMRIAQSMRCTSVPIFGSFTRSRRSRKPGSKLRNWTLT